MLTKALIIDVQGLELTPEDREILTHPFVGGVILFARNYTNPQQLRALTTAIRQVNPELLITVDHEGGRVQRFREGFTRIPPAAEFGKLYTTNPQLALIELAKAVTTMISELHAVGVDFSFAPVLDVDYGQNTVIGDRSFNQTPEIVAQLGAAYIDAVHANNGFAVGKHFPGHGGVRNDTHVAVAVDERDMTTILANDLLPFQIAIEHKIDAIMLAHVIYKAIDPNPATFSSYWIKNVLREKLNFRGIIFSDDLNMQAASIVGDFDVRVKLALDAGCNKVLICNNRDGVKKILKN